MNTLNRLLIISRPIFWPSFAAAYWWGVVSSGARLDFYTALGLFFVTFPMHLMVFGVNDIADREMDALNPRKGRLDGAVVRRHETRAIKYGLFIAWAICIIPLVLAQRYSPLIPISVIIAFAITYSVGPIRLKSRPLLDSGSNGIWLAAVFLTGYLMADQGQSLNNHVVRQALIAWLLGTAIHAYGALLDHTADSRVGQRTISTSLGRRPTALLCCLLLATAFLLSFKTTYLLRYLVGGSLGLTLLILLMPTDEILRKVKYGFYWLIGIPLPVYYILVNLS